MAAMDSLDQRAPECAEIPRFDDGMVNIQELIRIMAESLVNEIMDAQAEDACADGNRRNGYRGRKLATGVDTVNLRIPKLRAADYGHRPHERQPSVEDMLVAGRVGR